MDHPPLDSLARISKLKPKSAAAENELRRRILSGTRRLDEGARHDLRLESRFGLPDNAAHTPAPTALRFRRYRPYSCYPFLQPLQHTDGLPPNQCRVLGDAPRKRKLADYEGQMDIDKPLVVALPPVGGGLPDHASSLVVASG